MTSQSEQLIARLKERKNAETLDHRRNAYFAANIKRAAEPQPTEQPTAQRRTRKARNKSSD